MRRIFANILFFLLIFVSGCTTSSNGNFFGNPNTVKVRKGDTLYSISRKYDVPLRDLIEANNLTPPYGLRVGQSLRVPANRYHIVARGDTLYSISRKYDVDVTSLSKMNGLRPPYSLSVGDKLVLPASVNSSSYSESVFSPSRLFSGSKSSSKASSSSSYSGASRSYKQQSYSAPVPKYRKEKFSWPVKGTVISQYGFIGKGRKNDGINIKVPAGTSVMAADKGTVVYSGNELKGFGNLILIKHPDGFITAYAHNDKLFVRKGQSVRRGQKISTVGKTGGVNTPQLHFEVHIGKKPVNPMSYLK